MNAEEKNAALKRSIDSSLVELITVSTKFGNITGLRLNKTTQFLGVPFATPPLGSKRW